MQDFAAVAILILVVVGIGAALTVIALDVHRAQTTPDPRTLPAAEMRAVGIAVGALIDQTKKSDPMHEKLGLLKRKLLNKGLQARLSAPEMRLAYQAVKFEKSSLLSKLADRGAYASPNTLQEYKEGLVFIRKFELKFREGVYVSTDIRED